MTGRVESVAIPTPPAGLSRRSRTGRKDAAVANREQPQAVLEELQDRIGPLLDQGARVRVRIA